MPGGGAAIALGPPTPGQREVLTYLEAHRRGARYLVATQSVSTATLYIRETGLPVLPLGGFSGRTPYPTLSRFRQLAAGGQLRYVIEPGPPAGGRPAATTADSIAAWVSTNCQLVGLWTARGAATRGRAVSSTSRGCQSAHAVATPNCPGAI